jgi:hypothetical protein
MSRTYSDVAPLRVPVGVYISIHALVAFSATPTKKKLIAGTLGAPEQFQMTIHNKTVFVTSRPFAKLVVDLLHARTEVLHLFGEFDCDIIDRVAAKFGWGRLPTTAVEGNAPCVKRDLGALQRGISAYSKTLLIDISTSPWCDDLHPQVVVADPQLWSGLLSAWCWASRISDMWQASGNSDGISIVCDFARRTLLMGVAVKLVVDEGPAAHETARLAVANGARLVTAVGEATHVVNLSSASDGSDDEEGTTLPPAVDDDIYMVQSEWVALCVATGCVLPPHFCSPPTDVVNPALLRRPSCAGAPVTLTRRWMDTMATRPLLLADETEPADVFRCAVLAGLMLTKMLAPPARAQRWLPLDALTKILLSQGVADASVLCSVLDVAGTPSARMLHAMNPVITPNDFVISTDGGAVALVDVEVSSLNGEPTKQQRDVRRAQRLDEKYVCSRGSDAFTVASAVAHVGLQVSPFMAAVPRDVGVQTKDKARFSDRDTQTDSVTTAEPPPSYARACPPPSRSQDAMQADPSAKRPRQEDWTGDGRHVQPQHARELNAAQPAPRAEIPPRDVSPTTCAMLTQLKVPVEYLQNPGSADHLMAHVRKLRDLKYHTEANNLEQAMRRYPVRRV